MTDEQKNLPSYRDELTTSIEVGATTDDKVNLIALTLVKEVLPKLDEIQAELAEFQRVYRMENFSNLQGVTLHHINHLFELARKLLPKDWRVQVDHEKSRVTHFADKVEENRKKIKW